ncbi:MAG: PD-(D/E)XK nuclease family protein [Oscillospiraceae bacterium]|nr:PD-(D/E)XK nuclease family protein [Oscillospiraceae bacterium]
MKTEKFFQEIYDICNQNRKEQEYNIFSVLEISRKEVFICRVLSDLINPEGNHGKGSKYLKTFLKDILNRDDADEIFKDAFVFKEYLINEEQEPQRLLSLTFANIKEPKKHRMEMNISEL